MERLVDRFRAARTQVLGISVDSRYCHAGWAVTLGGISFPLLADFNPKGEVARSYGLYLDGQGITDRATVLIDGNGTVRHISSVTPSGQRDIAQLAGLCEDVHREHGNGLPAPTPPPGIPPGAVLYVKSNCGFSRAALQSLENLHLTNRVPVRNVSEDPAAREELRTRGGKEQAPCLVSGDQALYESLDIIAYLCRQVTDIPC